MSEKYHKVDFIPIGLDYLVTDAEGDSFEMAMQKIEPEEGYSLSIKIIQEKDVLDLGWEFIRQELSTGDHSPAVIDEYSFQGLLMKAITSEGVYFIYDKKGHPVFEGVIQTKMDLIAVMRCMAPHIIIDKENGKG